VVPLIQMK